MSSATPPSNLHRMGDLLVKEGLLTPDALQKALKYQADLESYKPLGRVCVELKLLSKVDLQRFLRKHQKSIHLGEILLNMGVITQAQLQHTLDQQNVTQLRFGELLVRHQIITETQLVDALSLQLDLPRIVPSPELVDRELLKALDEDFLRTHECLPIHKYENQMVVVMADPLNGELIQRLIDVYSCRIMPSIATSSEILACLSALFDAASTRQNTLNMSPELVQLTHKSQLSEEKMQPVAQFLVRSAVEAGATALHIETHENYLRVRFRIDGQLQHKTDLPQRMAPMLLKALKTPFRLKRERLWEERITTQVSQKRVHLSISFFPGVWGESLVMHIAHAHPELLELDSLSFSPFVLRQVQQFLNRSGGVLLAVSPMRQGKSTLLYACLQYLSQSSQNILTLEDAVEQLLPTATQHQYPPESKDSYAAMIEAMTDYDSDLLMVSEVKNKDVADRLNRAALVGKKVFSAVASNDTTTALYQLKAMGAEALLASPVPVVVIAQKLVRKLCPHCRELAPLDISVLQSLGVTVKTTGEQRQTYEARGCQHCHQIGYLGVTALHEVFEIFEGDRQGILRGDTASALRENARKTRRFLSMTEDGIYKALSGLTSLNEVVKTVMVHEGDLATPRHLEDIYYLCQGQS